MQMKRFGLYPEFGTNTYLLWNENSLEAILIDPADEGVSVIHFITDHHLTVKWIINTHGHADHIGGNRYFHDKLGVPIAIHEDDASMLPNPRENLSVYLAGPVTSPEPGWLLRDGDRLPLGEETLAVLHTPGHTPGGICLLGDGFLIAGDTLFAGSIGRTDFPGGDSDALLAAIQEQLLPLPDATLVFPGHGPQTTIGDERRDNPFLR
jgi:glyoxylase-like metal-dependent hydrolase (beta-lactamase superfamily II)